MAKLYITEYEHLCSVPGGPVGVGREPAITSQTLTIDGSSDQSAAFNPRTHFIRLHCDTICSVEVGTDPTATTDSKRMAASQTEYFGVPPGGGLKVAVIANT